MATDSDKLTLNSLPNEILLKIFAYLDVHEVCFTIAKVCERWNFLINDVTLWKNLNLICNKDMSTEYITSVISEMPLLKCIQLQWRTDVELIFQQLCNNCEDIRQVELVCCGQMKAKSMQLLTDNFPDLEVFSMGKCWAIDSNCFKLVSKFTQLRKLNLSHSRKVDGLLLRDIVDSCHFLQHINVDYVRGLSDEDVMYLLESKKNKLLSLVLYAEGLTDIAYSYLEKCILLHTLHLSSCLLMTDKGLRSVSKINSLKSFKLRLARNVSTEALNNFVLSKVASNLDFLILSRLPNMNDAVTRNISINCTRLKYFELVYCPNVTDQSAEIVLSGCKLLKLLQFRQNGPNCRPAALN